MIRRLLLLVVAVAAVAALVGTIAYAAVRATNGMMGRSSMMNGGGYSMMGGNGQRSDWYRDGTGPVSTIPAARAQAQRFAERLGLRTAEVIQFTDNFYVGLDDKRGKPATEVLVDPQTGDVTLEYGPAMMWNTRYGMMAGAAGVSGGGGMMGGSGSGMMGGSGSGMMGGSGSGMMGRVGSHPSWTPGNVSGSVNEAQARELANRWLAQQGTGQSAGDLDAFPGYYTMETLEDGKIAGMISVNKATGAVWYHWWHGRFVAISE